MTKTCNECGCQMDDNAQVCPQCGCSNTSSSQEWDSYFYELQDFSTDIEAEKTVKNIARGIRVFGTAIAIIMLLMFFGVGIPALAESKDNGWPMISYGVVIFLTILFMSQAIWAIMMLFVNMSITLKRIEFDHKQ